MNVAAFLLGLVSLAFAVCGFRARGCLICCTGSLLSCGGALVCQLWEVYRLTLLGDTAAVYDTAHARAVAACILLGLNAGLHLLALVRRRKQKREKC